MAYAYFDTNILSFLAKNPELLDSVKRYFDSTGLTLVVGEANLFELSEAKNLHDSLGNVFEQLNASLAKGLKQLFFEEVDAYPNFRVNNLGRQLVADDDQNQTLPIKYLLTSSDLYQARMKHKELAATHPDQLSKLKVNFPPTKSGRYTIHQAEAFTNRMTIQWILRLAPRSLEKIGPDIFSASFENKSVDGRLDQFLSVRSYALVLFYKHYLGTNRKPELSDFGDLHHLSALPYCELVIMERDMCGILQQIKSDSIFQYTTIGNISTLTALST